MATAALRHEVDELRELLTELSRQSLRSELSISRLSEEMREFKEEMSAFKEETVRDRQRMNRQCTKTRGQVLTCASKRHGVRDPVPNVC
jgi:predicted  nucleic acid-binding Zn-ribbon protein